MLTESQTNLDKYNVITCLTKVTVRNVKVGLATYSQTGIIIYQGTTPVVLISCPAARRSKMTAMKTTANRTMAPDSAMRNTSQVQKDT